MDLNLFVLVWTLMVFILLCERESIRCGTAFLKFLFVGVLVFALIMTWILISFEFLSVLGVLGAL
jgi:hypothetical protein